MFKKIYIEITNNCNLNCNFCPKVERTKENITIERFKILLNKIKNHTNYLYFHIMGEPLLHKDINELIDIASKNFKINITTNGYLINNIKTNNIRQINISLHAFNESYSKSLDAYLNDIFIKTKELTNTYINYRIWTNSKYHKDIIDKINKNYNTSIKGNISTKIINNTFLEIEEEFIWPSLKNNYCNKVGKCYGTIDHIGVLVDGTVVPCCLDYAGITNLGNIYKQELSDIISSELFTNMKNNFKVNKKTQEICWHCNFNRINKGE